MKRTAWIIGFLVSAACLFAGCIKNDIPYPRREGLITAFKVRGQIGETVIDKAGRTVTVNVADTVEMTKVKLLQFETTDSTTVSPEIDAYLDLTDPVEYTLMTYPEQYYIWTVLGNQTIHRFIRAKSQVGDATFNVDEHYAVLYVAEDQDLSDIEILDIQLGPSDAVMEPDPRNLHDFSSVQKIKVSYRGRTEDWLLNVLHKKASALTNPADAWSYFARLSGVASPTLGTPSFQYRLKSETEWKEIPFSDLFIEGANVSATLKELKPSTEYVCRIVAGKELGNEVFFRTETPVQMMNMNFDAWIKDGKSWFPNADLQDSYWWDSGNKGANSIGEANPTSPEEFFLAVEGPGKKAVRMETIAVLGAVMAGGNIFSGQYLKTSGMGAQVGFGRPFTSRPLQLKGYYAYAPRPIDMVKDPYAHMKGRMDRCHIFVYVTDWDAPYIVDTNRKIFLDVNDPHVIGYGSFVDSLGTDGKYKPFTLDIRYRNTRTPKYCAVVAVASYYADYFTGGKGSVMYVDEFRFEYDGTVKWEDRTGTIRQSMTL